MEGKSFGNRSRRTTIMPVRMKTGSSKKLHPVKMNPTCKSTNKENEYRGIRRNLMSSRPSYNPKIGKPSKGFGYHATIPRRLSFPKNDNEVLTPSYVDKLPANMSISSNASNDLIRPCDESLLYPVNSTSTVVNVRSPFNSNFMGRTVQKAPYASGTSPLKFSENMFFRSASSTPKVSLSEETKLILKKMGIDPDGPIVPQHKKKETTTDVEEVKESKYFHKDIQKLPILNSAKKEENFAGGHNDIWYMVEMMTDIYSRQAKERQDLESRHSKEIEEAISKFQGGEPFTKSGNEPCQMNFGDEMKASTFQAASGVVSVRDAANDPVPVVTVTGLSISSEQKCSTGGDSCLLTAELKSQECLKSETEPKDIDVVPHPEVITNPLAESCSHAAAIATDVQVKLERGPNDQLNQVRINPCQQSWRNQEISFLETPQSGKWLVTQGHDEDLSFSNTPSCGLNSLLKGMTINGHSQEVMETPATRRLVTKRILKGVESLFY